MNVYTLYNPKTTLDNQNKSRIVFTIIPLHSTSKQNTEGDRFVDVREREDTDIMSEDDLYFRDKVLIIK